MGPTQAVKYLRAVFQNACTEIGGQLRETVEDCREGFAAFKKAISKHLTDEQIAQRRDAAIAVTYVGALTIGLGTAIDYSLGGSAAEMATLAACAGGAFLGSALLLQASACSANHEPYTFHERLAQAGGVSEQTATLPRVRLTAPLDELRK